MMTRQEAESICDAGKETVVRVLLELSGKADQLTADFAALKAENVALRTECQALRDRVQTLEEQIAKDSHNSHKPPSSDGLAKPKPKSLRKPSGRPSPGHPGHTLRMRENPDRTVRHTVERCSDCGRSLSNQEPDRVERRQVFDLPEPKLEVTEHQGEVKTCSCGCVNRADFPTEASTRVQYGTRVKSVAVYLKEYQSLPFERLGEIMRDLFACESFSQGTLANFSTDCSQRLDPVDRYPYLKYDCDHAFCNAHLLRELTFLWEEQKQKWAKMMIDHLLAIKDAVDSARYAGHNSLPDADTQQFLQDYQRIVAVGYDQNPAAKVPSGPKRRGRRKQSKARNLLDRFQNHAEGILAFMHDFAVPFDNNLSERDLRMMKLRQKISGTFRNFDALVNFCRIRGYVSTARKNGLNALDALRRVFDGIPFVPACDTS